jgi:hypothetical protein
MVVVVVAGQWWRRACEPAELDIECCATNENRSAVSIDSGRSDLCGAIYGAFAMLWRWLW